MRGPLDLVPCRDCISCGTEKTCAICATHCHAGHTVSEDLKWSRCTCEHNDPKLHQKPAFEPDLEATFSNIQSEQKSDFKLKNKTGNIPWSN